MFSFIKLIIVILEIYCYKPLPQTQDLITPVNFHNYRDLPSHVSNHSKPKMLKAMTGSPRDLIDGANNLVNH